MEERTWIDWLVNLLPLLVLVGFWIWVFRWSKKGAHAKKWDQVTEKSLALAEQQLQELREMKELLRKVAEKP
jgi:ATP-dependent Zn protease